MSRWGSEIFSRIKLGLVGATRGSANAGVFLAGCAVIEAWAQGDALGRLRFESKGDSSRWLWLSKPLRSHFEVGEFTTHFRTCFSGDWDVHWGVRCGF